MITAEIKGIAKNEFYNQVKSAEDHCESVESLKEILGKARAKKGMFEGNLVDGELEIGQVSSMMQNIISAKEVVDNTWNEFNSLFVSLNERS